MSSLALANASRPSSPPPRIEHAEADSSTRSHASRTSALSSKEMDFLSVPNTTVHFALSNPGSPESPSSMHFGEHPSRSGSPVFAQHSILSGPLASSSTISTTYSAGAARPASRSSKHRDGEHFMPPQFRNASRVSGLGLPRHPNRSACNVALPAAPPHSRSPSVFSLGRRSPAASRESLASGIRIESGSEPGSSHAGSVRGALSAESAFPPEHLLHGHTASVGTSLDGYSANHTLVSSSVAIPAGHGAIALCLACDGDVLRAHEIFPISTAYVSGPRYNETARISLPVSPHAKITPVKLRFTSDAEHLHDWLPLQHPEGSVYFYHQAKRIYTNAYIYDKGLFDRVETAAEQIEHAKLHYKNGEISDTAELVLELAKDDRACYYYMVDHENRTLFWLNDYDPTGMLQEVDGVTIPEHMKHEFECHYWTHWELFPHDHPVTEQLLEELTGILLHSSYDSMTSLTSIAPYSSKDFQAMSTTVNRIRNAGSHGGYSACVYGRMMATFAHERFLHFAGTPFARLNRTQSVLDGSGKRRRTWLITSLSFALFCAPDVHLKKLEDIWIDRMINQVPWKKFIKRLEEEWKDLILLSTVLLSANAALLEVPDIVASGDSQSTDFRNRSLDEVLSYVSIVASIGSIIIGLLLVRHYRTKARDTAADAAKHLNEHTHSTRGLETLAILYSLPYAGLMWGMVAFLASFACLCLRATSVPTKIPVVLVLFIVLALIAWCIHTGWEKEPESRWHDLEGSGRVARDKLKETLPSLWRKVLHRWRGPSTPDIEVQGPETGR